MSKPLASAEWNKAVARLIRADGGDGPAASLTAAISEVVDHDGTCLLAFHANAPPQVLHHSLDPAGAIHFVDRYLAGPYLLDPLYQLALRDSKPGICRYRDAAPDRFRSSQYYRRYCERTHLTDEMDFLVDADTDTALALVVGRRGERFTKAELRRLEQIESIVHAAMLNSWDSGRAGSDTTSRDDSVHRRLTECFENFGEPLLTSREQETSKLLLRGFSTKAIARHLRIAPGTVMVHKRNLFSKLGISSQYELFSLFLSSLSANQSLSDD